MTENRQNDFEADEVIELDEDGRLPRLSLRERVVDFVAGVVTDRPRCRVCGSLMQWRNLGDLSAWTRPYGYREDHISTKDGDSGC